MGTVCEALGSRRDLPILQLGSRLLSIPANAIVDRRLLPVLLGLGSAVPSAIDDHRCCYCWQVLQSVVELMVVVLLLLVVLGFEHLVHAQNRCSRKSYRVLGS